MSNGECTGNLQSEQAETFTLGWKGICIILLFGTSLLVAYHLSGRALTMHEVIFAQPAKEMLASGDWLVPRIAGEVFTDKPLLTMWLIAACMQLSGSESEWVVRLPSSAAMLVTALMIGMTAARWLGRRIGIQAGLIQLSSYYMLQMGTLAEADMLLICSVTACYCFFAWTRIDSPAGRMTGRWTPWGFHGLLGLVFMIKGPVGVIFVASGLGLFMLLRRDWSLLGFFFHPGGLLFFAILALPYPFLAGMRHPPILEDWLIHNWGRFRGEMSHLQERQPFLFYLYHLPLMLLPTAPWLILGCWDRSIWQKPITRWVWCWCVPGVLFLSLSAWKWKHYMSPVLPGLTLFMACGLDRWLFSMADVLHRFWRPLMIMVATVSGVSFIAVLVTEPLGKIPLLILIPVLTIASLVVLELSYRRWQRILLPSLAVLTWTMIVSTFCLVMPAHDQFRIQVEFAERINQRLELHERLHLVNMSYEQILFYLKRPMVQIDRLEQILLDEQCSTSPIYVLIRSGDYDSFVQHGALHIMDVCSSHQRRGDSREAILLVKIEPVQQASQINK